MSFRSALGRARGLAFAKEGVHHWWLQRLTAIVLIPLTIWFVVSLIGLTGASYSEFLLWVGSPLNATLMVLFLGVGFYHAQLGMQVVIEDYVGSHRTRTTVVMLSKLGCYGLSLLSIFSVIIIAFKG